MATDEQLPPQQKPVLPSLARQAALSGAPAHPAQLLAATQLPPQQRPELLPRTQLLSSAAPAQEESRHRLVPLSQAKPAGQLVQPEAPQLPLKQLEPVGQASPAKPQLSGSAWKSVQLPAEPQLPKPPPGSAQTSPAPAPAQLA